MKQQEIYRIFACRGFEDIGRALKQQPDLYAVWVAASDADPSQAMPYYLAQGHHAFERGDQDAFRAVSDRIDQAYQSAPPLPLLIMQLYSFFLEYDISSAIRHLVRFAEHAIDCRQWNQGCEAVGTAFLLDYHHRHELLEDIEASQRLMQLYEKAAQGIMGSDKEDGGEHIAYEGRKLRIGLLVPNLVDDLVAFSKRVRDFVEYAGASVDLFVFSSENACVRSRAIPVPLVSHSSEKRAPHLIRLLQERGVPLYMADGGSDIVTASQQLADAITRSGLDALFLQSSGAMPIDWLAARMANVPRKIQIHIGQSMYIPGFYATVFDNSVNMAREQSTWPDYAGKQVLIRKGTDIARLDAEPSARRSEWGIPEDAILIGTLSNWLEERLSDAYMKVILGVLLSEPKVMFTPIGAEDIPVRVQEKAKAAGVLNQVRFIPRQRNAAGCLKMLDIYASEFPAGGSQAVIEAMACGCPVVAMRCGDAHHASIGADFVGSPWAIDRYDECAYRDTLLELVKDPVLRKKRGSDMGRKAREEYSIDRYIGRLIALAGEGGER